MLHGPRGREEEEQERPLAPGTDDAGTHGHGEHQEVNVELSLADAFPGIPGRIPAAAEIGQEIEARGDRAVVKDRLAQEAKNAEEKATSRKGRHHPPLLVLLVITERGVSPRRVLRETGSASGFEP